MPNRGPLGLLLLGAAGAVAARVALRTAKRVAPRSALERTNFRGRPVSLAGGPALAAAASTAAAFGATSPPVAAAALVAGAGAGAVGLYDDIVGARPDQRAAKGFAGHLSALRSGRVTSGLVKIVGVGAAATAAAALLAADRRDTARRPVTRAADVLLGAGVIAGTANLVNLLDLRPGRAAKAGLLIAAPLLAGPTAGTAAGTSSAVLGLLRDDLDEQVMLGDCGANALGALLGLAVAQRTGPAGRAAVLAVLAGLTVASERVSFTQVIARTPGLRELDALGRRTP
ncbi:hypothetical protein EDC02_1520 [Micromonospora sp. Llam0]|uniref:hypothetical protein n=1 Tax=Micromonospora sp. Llam0 TaxID=2485143 RepID=UPI000F466A9B|nr:hypothetical protein [Micromonospora sp. Llam0]ROO59709.1 hypothetical protein EDC02_1520 [Micromonospora sp. Llam0]